MRNASVHCWSEHAFINHHCHPELIDEIAFTTGELTLVLTNYPSHEKKALVQEALSHAQSLRVRLRADQSQSDQVTKDCDDFNREIARLLIVSKKAA